MRTLSVLFILATGLVWFSCKEKTTTDETRLDITFTGVYAGQPLVMFDGKYDCPENVKASFHLFQFYLTDIALQKTSGEWILVSPVSLVTFRDQQTKEEAEKGVTLSFSKVPVGNYQAIRYNLGLTEALNKTSPADYKPGAPLSDNYWSWALGYVFYKIEGIADTEGKGVYASKLTFHTGANSLLRTLTFPSTFNLTPKKTHTLPFTADLAKVLQTGDQVINFRTTTQDHTTNMQIAERITNNLAGAIGLKE